MAFKLQNTPIFLALFVLSICASQANSRTLQQVSMQERHEKWMSSYGRVYKDDVERNLRFNIFKDNVEFIESFNNAGNRRYKLSINEFADQTNEEFQASRNGYKRSSSSRPAETLFKYENVAAVPSSMDWRKKGAVTPVKDQGQCGN